MCLLRQIKHFKTHFNSLMELADAVAENSKHHKHRFTKLMKSIFKYSISYLKMNKPIKFKQIGNALESFLESLHEIFVK